MLPRFHLPPNLAATAERDAVAVKIEAEPDLTKTEPLRSFNLHGRGPWYVQLSRGQLNGLVEAYSAKPVFFWINRPGQPIQWNEERLPGVTDHLAEPRADIPAPEPDPVAPLPAPATRRENRARSPATPPTVDGSEHFLAISLPARDHPAYAEVLETLKNNGFLLEPSNRKWWLRDRRKTLEFLARHWDRMESEWNTKFTDNFRKNTSRFSRADVVTELTEDDGEFQLDVAVRARGVDTADIEAALAAGRNFTEARDRLVLIPPDAVKKIEYVRSMAAGRRSGSPATRFQARVFRAAAPGLQPVLDSVSPEFRPPEAWRSLTAALGNFSRLQPPPVPAGLRDQLRSYQLIGVAWMYHLARTGLAGILADEMGLGKTVQALALLACLREESKISDSCLVVCPAGLLENWRREAARFLPGLPVFIHHGARRLESNDVQGTSLILTSYTTLARDVAVFRPTRFLAVIGDEAQHVKNPRTGAAAALRELRATHRFLLTGTPVENRLDELHALFDFLLPGLLPAPPGGGGAPREEWTERIRRLAAPYILRRTKAAVAPELPERIEQTIWCSPTPTQADLFHNLLKEGELDIQELELAGRPEGQIRMAVLTRLLRLRELCCDPRLVFPETPPDASAKRAAFREILDEALDDGHRLLVFSQFTRLLDLVEGDLKAMETSFLRIDGSTPPRQRQRIVDQFQNSPEIPVMLLSLKAGGTGLNLTGADTIVHLDPWWNPAAEAQASDRAHRIGQTRTVTIYRLLLAETVEEGVYGLQERKRRLLLDLFAESEAATASLALADLKNLLTTCRTSRTTDPGE